MLTHTHSNVLIRCNLQVSTDSDACRGQVNASGQDNRIIVGWINVTAGVD